MTDVEFTFVGEFNYSLPENAVGRKVRCVSTLARTYTEGQTYTLVKGLSLCVEGRYGELLNGASAEWALLSDDPYCKFKGLARFIKGVEDDANSRAMS